MREGRAGLPVTVFLYLSPIISTNFSARFRVTSSALSLSSHNHPCQREPTHPHPTVPSRGANTRSHTQRNIQERSKHTSAQPHALRVGRSQGSHVRTNKAKHKVTHKKPSDKGLTAETARTEARC